MAKLRSKVTTGDSERRGTPKLEIVWRQWDEAAQLGTRATVLSSTTA